MKRVILICCTFFLLTSNLWSADSTLYYFKKVKGICLFEFKFDSTVSRYFLHKSTFLSQPDGVIYSIAGNRNAMALKMDCSQDDEALIRISKDTSNYKTFRNLYKYSFSETPGYISEIKGVFYVSADADKVYACYEIEGDALIIKDGCQKYKSNFGVNNYPAPESSYCEGYKNFPQVIFLHNVKEKRPGKKSLLKNRLILSPVKTISLSECI